MSNPRFSPDALKQQVDKLPANQAQLGVAVEGTDVGIQGSVSTPLGKGWTVSAAGQWFKEKGYAAAAWFKWTGT